MRQDVREYLRANANLFGLMYQENAVTEAEGEAVVSYAQELAKRLVCPVREMGNPFHDWLTASRWRLKHLGLFSPPVNLSSV